jgi:molybdopterin biosynthesis enzyme
LNLTEKQIHEDDAALRIAQAVCGKGLVWSQPSEGKTNMVSPTDGLFKINTQGLLRINKIGNIIISTLNNNFPVKKNQTIAATRIIPLIIARKKIERLETLAKKYHPIVQVLPYRKLKVGAVVTGSELYQGLIKDEFDKYVGDKISGFGSKIIKKIVVPDDPNHITGAIKELVRIGCELILTTGGLSVDPDDVTRTGIIQAGARVVVYGTPILPGAMFLYAFMGDIPLLGLPACVFYHATTVFDLLLPRVLAGDVIKKDDIAAMGHGGLCMNCRECRYPVCPFGK